MHTESMSLLEKFSITTFSSEGFFLKEKINDPFDLKNALTSGGFMWNSITTFASEDFFLKEKVNDPFDLKNVLNLTHEFLWQF